MDSLGVGALTDDQLIELLELACEQLALRNHYVQELAQAVIISNAEQMKLAAQALREEAELRRTQYVGEIRRAVSTEIRDAVRSGTLRVCDVREEADIAAEAELQTKLELLREVNEHLTSGQANFFMTISGGYLTISFGPRRVTTRCVLSPENVERLSSEIAGLLGG